MTIAQGRLLIQKVFESWINELIANQDVQSSQISMGLFECSRRIRPSMGCLRPTVATKIAAMIGGGQTLNNTSTRQTSVGGSLPKAAVGVMTTATGLAMRPITFTINPERDTTVQLNLSPQTGQFSVVYGLYLQYLALQSPIARFDIVSLNNPKKITHYLRFDSSKVFSLCHSVQPPSSYVPGTLKRWNGEWYYIPEAFAQKYFELCMLIRDQPIVTSQTEQTARGVQQLLKRPVSSPSQP
jgi:hypothetical protein